MRSAIVLGLVLSLVGCGVEAAPTGHLEAEAARTGPLFDNCTFRVNSACSNSVHADSVCVEARLGGGYYVETMNRLHCSPNPTCESGSIDIRLVRICNTAAVGEDFVTPCGDAGPNGCAVCWSEATCE